MPPSTESPADDGAPRIVEVDRDPRDTVVVGATPNGDALVLRTGRRTVSVVDRATRVERLRFDEFEGDVDSVSVSPDGRVIAVSDDHQVTLYDRTAGTLLRRIPDASGPVAVSPDHKLVAAVARANTTATGVVVALLEGGSAHVIDAPETLAFDPVDLVFSSDGRSIRAVSGGELDVAAEAVFDLTTDRSRASPLPGATRERRVLAASSAGFVVGAYDASEALVFDRTRRTTTRVRVREDSLYQVALSPRGTLLAVGGPGDVSFYAVATGKPVQTLGDESCSRPGSGGVLGALMFADEHTLVSSSGCVWDLTAKRTSRWLETPRVETRAVALSPAGDAMALAGEDGVVRIFDLARGAITRSLPWPRSDWAAQPFESVAFSPDGRWLAADATDLGRLFVWDTSSGALAQAFTVTPRNLWAIAWLDADRVISADYIGGFTVWSVSAGRAVAVSPQRDRADGAQGIAVSPDGRTVVALAGHALTYLDPASANVTAARPNALHGAKGIRFSTDGRSLVYGLGKELVWEAAPSQERIQAFEGHRDRILGAAVLPEGDQVVSSSGDGSVRLWRRGDVDAKVLLADGVRLGGLALSRDGSLLFVAGPSTRVWRLPGGEPLGSLTATDDPGGLLFATPQGSVQIDGGARSLVACRLGNVIVPFAACEGGRGLDAGVEGSARHPSSGPLVGANLWAKATK